MWSLKVNACIPLQHKQYWNNTETDKQFTYAGLLQQNRKHVNMAKFAWCAFHPVVKCDLPLDNWKAVDHNYW